MKKTLGLIALAALVMLAGCKKNEEQPTGSTKLIAGIEQQKSDSKTSLNPNDLTITWSADDHLFVYNGATGADFALSTGAGTTKAEFTGDCTFTDSNLAVYPYNDNITVEGNMVTMTLPAEQNATVGNFGNGANPMLGFFSDFNNLQLTSLCGVLCLELTGDNVAITKIELVGGADDKLNGTFEADYTVTLTSPVLVKTGTDGTNKVTLNCTATLTTTPQKFFVVLPAGTLHGFTMKVYNGDNVIFTKSTANAITFQANYVESMTETPVTTHPQGAINGLFKVSATQQVYFSKGNLQYIGSASTPYWKFADNQWDYLGITTGQNSTNPNVNRDLFGWGTWTGSNPNPANTSSNDSDYSWDNLDFVKTLQNGSGTWRTLNYDEWGYLFYLRASGATVTTTSGTTNDARYTEATINTDGTGVNGIILFPDGVTIASGEATSWGDINNPSDYGTTCTTAQWTALANKGCVFLPAAGRRHTTWDPYATSVQINGGYYWSSTASTTYGPDYACSMYFYSGYVDPQTDDDRRFSGYSVRLVQDKN